VGRKEVESGTSESDLAPVGYWPSTEDTL